MRRGPRGQFALAVAYVASDKFKQRFGDHAGIIDEIDREMRQHDRRQGFHAHVGDHKHGTDRRRDQYDVQASASVYQAEGNRGNKYDRKPTLRVAAEEGVHVASEKEFLQCAHCNEPQREVDPVPGRARDIRHAGKRRVPRELFDQGVSLSLIHISEPTRPY